jgi:hypothetical protein
MTLADQQAAAVAWNEPDGLMPRGTVVVVPGRHDVLNDQTHRTVAAAVVLFLERIRQEAAPHPIAGLGAVDTMMNRRGGRPSPRVPAAGSVRDVLRTWSCSLV